MSSEKRSITINPEMFKISSTTTRKKSQSGITKPKIKIRNPAAAKERNNKSLKLNLLKYLRRQQEVNYRELKGDPKPNASESTKKDKDISEFQNSFDESVDYLLKLTKEIESHKTQLQEPKNHTLKHYPDTEPSTYIGRGSSYPKQSATCEPPYGCLKGGQLPTYRVWHNKTQRNLPVADANTTRQNPSTAALTGNPALLAVKPPTKINEMASSPFILPQRPQERLKTEQMKQIAEKEPPKPKRNKQKQKTVRRTYRVGKSKIYPKISVLVSNRTIRKNVMSQTQLLKQTPISEIKTYLIKKGFIRVGSIAPNDVLRRMYETAKTMCGEIQNHNPENLLYNFLNSATEEYK